jgi:type IV pilus biogenesis protein CpaD/CtpE
MRYLICGLIAAALTGCASSDKVRTFSEAVESDGEIRSGVYLNQKGENVAVTTVNARTRIAELENQLTDAQRQVEFYKRRTQEMELENLQLRARNNYELQKEVKQVVGFDKANNPIVQTTSVEQTPKKLGE